MDWNAAIERNREALKRIVAALAAIAGLGAASSSPLVGEDGSARRGEAEPPAEPGEGCLSISRPTLPRHLHRAVLRLLRPAEAAARRLVIVIARDLVLPPPAPPRPRKSRPDPKAGHAALRGLGIAIVMPHNVPHREVRGESRASKDARAAAGKSRRPHPEARNEAEPRKAVLPLFDPLPRLLSLSKGRVRRRTVPPHAAPRILSFGGATPHRLPPPPAPDDLIDASRLALRLQALASALDDLPGQARRFARWKMRRRLVPPPFTGGPKDGRDPWLAPARDHAKHGGGGTHHRRCGRVSPLRPGRPPGLSAANRRRPTHEVHEVLGDLQYFAVKALEPPDTS